MTSKTKPAPAKATTVLSEEGKAASRASIIAALAVGETYSVTEYVEDDVRAENIQAVMTEIRNKLTQRISSTLKFCQQKTGNVYARETLAGPTTKGRFAVSLIIERTA